MGLCKPFKRFSKFLSAGENCGQQSLSPPRRGSVYFRLKWKWKNLIHKVACHGIFKRSAYLVVILKVVLVDVFALFKIKLYLKFSVCVNCHQSWTLTFSTVFSL